MDRYVFGIGGVVVAITPSLPQEPSVGAFDLVAPYQEGVVEGMTMTLDANDKVVFGPAPAPPAPTGAQLVAYAQLKQTLLMAGGFAFNVAPPGEPAKVCEADTDVGGRLNLSGLVSLATLNPDFTSVWVQSTGGFILTASQVIALGVAVGTFVEQTYRAFAGVVAGIQAGTVTTFAEIDAAPWPPASGAAPAPAASGGSTDAPASSASTSSGGATATAS